MRLLKTESWKILSEERLRSVLLQVAFCRYGHETVQLVLVVFMGTVEIPSPHLAAQLSLKKRVAHSKKQMDIIM